MPTVEEFAAQFEKFAERLSELRDRANWRDGYHCGRFHRPERFWSEPDALEPIKDRAIDADTGIGQSS